MSAASRWPTAARSPAQVGVVENREWNAGHPGDQKFAPDWDKHPRSSDKHPYWGIEPRNAFTP